MKKSFISAISAIALTATNSFGSVVDFSDLTLPPDSFYNGGPSYNSDGWTSGGAGFNNNFGESFGFDFWNGFAYSNVSDKTTEGFGNQYSAIPGVAALESIYAIGYQDSFNAVQPTITLPTGLNQPLSIRITNSTYAYFSMLNGDDFTVPFDQDDWFLLTITALDIERNSIGAVDFYLADFRSGDSSEHYILDEWANVDLQPLGAGVHQLQFSLDSSDFNEAFGSINTPSYFAMDGLELVPEPSAFMLLVGLGIARLLRRQRK